MMLYGFVLYGMFLEILLLQVPFLTSLCICQGIEDELASLPGKYSAPGGAILLASKGGSNLIPFGCVAVRPCPDAGEGCCEMKRMFVQPNQRGHKAGYKLAVAVLDKAKELGYKCMVLDTLERLQSATKIYRALGFQECEAYYHNPIEEPVLYLSKHI
eukprot:CAMPEP_0114316392 /NCGR_PEP_ID=MMETSP0059-20121206/23175_1 /TAXON_ID=36894 /ORGANISM="Pyramimonas parkeae, Strain CCMP726" /LENGTH=157 /DNA_ID=CAMNT_0001442313 /DNA_START=1257 /DNA_END=1730 /DNA_ORIENTATION=-